MAITPEEEVRALTYVIKRFEAELHKKKKPTDRAVIAEALDLMRCMCSTILEKKEHPSLH